MSFMHEVKYRGCIQITGWAPSHAQPRPGLVEANNSLKRLLVQEKQSTLCVLSVSSEMGLKCVDTSFNPPKVVMSNTIPEIAHCNVDVTKPEYFTCIVGGGKPGGDQLFFCHVFKCQNKETANKITRAVASACTLAYQARLEKQQHQQQPQHQQSFRQQSAPVLSAAPASNFSRGYSNSSTQDPKQSFQRSVRATVQRQSVRAQASPYGAVPLIPKLTDAWFRPTMNRVEVNNILRDARVGDFIIRESQTQPGDYALAVQTGTMVWTGLIIQTPRGFQIGKNGTMQFNELTDLVAYYMNNTFMENTNGEPLYLRLPYDNTASPAERKPAFKNPPAFGGDDFSSQFPPSQFPPSASAAEISPMPACGWPESDEDDAPAFVGGRGKSQSAGEQLLDEKSAFESIMNGDVSESEVHDEIIDGINMREMDQALAEAQQEEDAKGSGLQAFSKQMFSTVPVDENGMVDGKDVRGVLMRSGLDTQTLGTIWMEVDQERRGMIDFDQFTLILGLISQAQSGLPVSLESLNIDAVDPPMMN